MYSCNNEVPQEKELQSFSDISRNMASDFLLAVVVKRRDNYLSSN
jgi:hypothetical protein